MDLDTFLELPPCQPIRYEYNLNGDCMYIYSAEQISIFGCPDEWTFPFLGKWGVVSTDNDERPMATDFSFDKSRMGNARIIHRYSRVKRFESVLYQLIGHRGDVDLADLCYIREQGVDPDPNEVWESIRGILKEGGLQKYYNRIPTIIQMLGIKLRIDIGKGADMITEITTDFSIMHQMFIQIKPEGRTYFPNLRFIALRMLETYGAKFEFNIPRVRTRRKLKPLDEMWINLFNSFQNKR